MKDKSHTRQTHFHLDSYYRMQAYSNLLLPIPNSLLQPVILHQLTWASYQPPPIRAFHQLLIHRILSSTHFKPPHHLSPITHLQFLRQILLPIPPRYTMQTRSQTGHSKPKPIYNLSSTTPHIILPSMAGSHASLILALQKQHTWVLVPPPLNHPILGCKWTDKTQRHPDGTIARYKARLVAQGSNQTYGLDYSETFSPVAKVATIRTFFLSAIQRGWNIHQIDVDNAFLLITWQYQRGGLHAPTTRIHRSKKSHRSLSMKEITLWP